MSAKERLGGVAMIVVKANDALRQLIVYATIYGAYEIEITKDGKAQFVSNDRVVAGMVQLPIRLKKDVGLRLPLLGRKSDWWNLAEIRIGEKEATWVFSKPTKEGGEVIEELAEPKGLDVEGIIKQAKGIGYIGLPEGEGPFSEFKLMKFAEFGDVLAIDFYNGVFAVGRLQEIPEKSEDLRRYVRKGLLLQDLWSTMVELPKRFIHIRKPAMTLIGPRYFDDFLANAKNPDIAFLYPVAELDALMVCELRIKTIDTPVYIIIAPRVASELLDEYYKMYRELPRKVRDLLAVAPELREEVDKEWKELEEKVKPLLEEIDKWLEKKQEILDLVRIEDEKFRKNQIPEGVLLRVTNPIIPLDVERLIEMLEKDRQQLESDLGTVRLRKLSLPIIKPLVDKHVENAKHDLETLKAIYNFALLIARPEEFKELIKREVPVILKQYGGKTLIYNIYDGILKKYPIGHVADISGFVKGVLDELVQDGVIEKLPGNWYMIKVEKEESAEEATEAEKPELEGEIGEKTEGKERIPEWERLPKEEIVEIAGYKIPKFPRELAERGWSYLSYFPERHAEQDEDYYKRVILNVIQKVVSAPLTDEERQKIIWDFAKRWIDKYKELAHVRATAASAHVVGPAKFPVERMQKKFERINKLEQELYGMYDEWFKWFKKYLERKKVKEVGRAEVIREEIERLKKELEKRKRWQEIMKEANKIVRSKLSQEEKMRRLKEIGAFDIPEYMLYFPEPDYMGRLGFPSYELDSNRQRIKRLEKRIKELEEKAKEAEMAEAKENIIVVEEHPKWKVIKNFEDDRVWVVFSETPPSEVRATLKSYGFRWSPKRQAWVRKLTPKAVEDALYILHRYMPPKEDKEEIEEPKPLATTKEEAERMPGEVPAEEGESTIPVRHEGHTYELSPEELEELEQCREPDFITYFPIEGGVRIRKIYLGNPRKAKSPVLAKKVEAVDLSYDSPTLRMFVGDLLPRDYEFDLPSETYIIVARSEGSWRHPETRIYLIKVIDGKLCIKAEASWPDEWKTFAETVAKMVGEARKVAVAEPEATAEKEVEKMPEVAPAKAEEEKTKVAEEEVHELSPEEKKWILELKEEAIKEAARTGKIRPAEEILKTLKNVYLAEMMRLGAEPKLDYDAERLIEFVAAMVAVGKRDIVNAIKDVLDIAEKKVKGETFRRVQLFGIKEVPPELRPLFRLRDFVEDKFGWEYWALLKPKLEEIQKMVERGDLAPDEARAEAEVLSERYKPFVEAAKKLGVLDPDRFWRAIEAVRREVLRNPKLSEKEILKIFRRKLKEEEEKEKSKGPVMRPGHRAIREEVVREIERHMEEEEEEAEEEEEVEEEEVGEEAVSEEVEKLKEKLAELERRLREGVHGEKPKAKERAVTLRGLPPHIAKEIKKPENLAEILTLGLRQWIASHEDEIPGLRAYEEALTVAMTDLLKDIGRKMPKNSLVGWLASTVLTEFPVAVLSGGIMGAYQRAWSVVWARLIDQAVLYDGVPEKAKKFLDDNPWTCYTAEIYTGRVEVNIGKERKGRFCYPTVVWFFGLYVPAVMHALGYDPWKYIPWPHREILKTVYEKMGRVVR
jgi:hypothetical protein